jgi:hypothetical protein
LFICGEVEEKKIDKSGKEGKKTTQQGEKLFFPVFHM